MAYPTPPPTSSPKDDLKHDYTTVHNFRNYETTVQHRPAQETYYHAVSLPNSPRQDHIALYQPPTQNAPEQRLYRSNTDSPKHFYGPPNQHTTDHIYDASPLHRPNDTRPPFKPAPTSISPPLYYDASGRPTSSHKRRTPPPRPLYFSPTNKPPSPYSISRPKPRPGFLDRLKNKLTQWIRSLMRWTKRNPIKAGLATFVPVMLGAGALRAFSGLQKVLGKLEKGMGGGVPGEKRVKKEAKKGEWGWGLDHFVGFGGTKGGPLDGIMKVLQMFMNHYARLTPSAVPRAACILLELYFLEKH